MLHPGWTAVVINYNGADYLAACLQALQSTSVRPRDIVVVDNASTDDSLQELHGFPHANVLAQTSNLGFARGANLGLATVETELAVLLNPDVEVARNFGAALVETFAADTRLGAAGPLLLYPESDRVQHAGGVIERPLMTTRHIGRGEEGSAAYSAPADVDFVTGGAMGLRMTAFQSVGGFDERFSPVYYEDADLCVRLRSAGWDVRYTPTLRAIHHEGVTLGHSPLYYRYLHENRIRFALKHLGSDEWRLTFIPAEFERLRHELHQINHADWAAQSGADAVESLLRGEGAPRIWDGRSLLTGPAPNVLSGRIDQARDLAPLPSPPPAAPRSRWQRLVDTEQEDDLREFLAEAFMQQSAFNAKVIWTMEAQDALNREQTAALLLFALDVLGRLRLSAEEGSETPGE